MDYKGILTDKQRQEIIDILLKGGEEAVYLLENVNGIDINITDRYGRNALEYAATEQNVEIFQFLLDHGANVTSHNYGSYGKRREDILLFWATEKALEKIVKFLLERGAKATDEVVNNCGDNIMHLAVRSGNSSLVQHFLDLGISKRAVNKCDETALKIARKDANVEIVKLLTKGRATVDFKTSESSVSYQSGSFVIGNVTDEESLLHRACKAGSQIFVERFVTEGADVNAKNKEGYTALHLAIKKGNENIIKYLLERGANVHIKTADYGYNALHLAVKTWNTAIVELVLNYGAFIDGKSDCNESGTGRETALSIACSKQQINIVQLLLQRGANFFQNETNILERSSVKVVRLLLNSGINVDARNSEYGNTALMNHLDGYYGMDELWGAFQHYYFKNEGKNKIEQLLDHGANTENNEILDLALYGDYLEILLEYQSDIDSIKEESLRVNALDGRLAFDPNNVTSEDSHSRNRKLMIRHIVKRLSERLHVDERFLKRIEADQGFYDFKLKCQSEIDKMKDKKIPETSLSAYDVLICKDPSTLAAYSRNEKVLKAVSSIRCVIEYPVYASTLNHQLRRGKWRCLLLNSVQHFFSAITRVEGNQGLARLPKICEAMVFSHLSNKDLRILINVCNVPFKTEIGDVEI